MELRIYKKDNESFPAVIGVVWKVGDTDPVGFTRVTDITEMLTSVFEWGASLDYKIVRDAAKQLITELTNGWSDLTASEQELAATHNLGTGAEIIAAIPSDDIRDENSRNYQNKVITVRRERAINLEAYVWSRCKHLDVNVGVPMPIPEYIYGKLTITSTGVTEMSGNLLVLFEQAGVQGLAGGDKTLGIYDFLLETVGTRYAIASGGGITNDSLISAQPAPSGFTTWAEFSEELYKYLHFGIW